MPQQALERAVAEQRFSGRRLFEVLHLLLRDDARIGGLYREVEQLLGAQASHALMGLVRATFLIELVNEAVTSTKFEVRWTPRLANDPRGASYTECEDALARLLEEGRAATDGSDERRVLTAFAEVPILPYEVPVDYNERKLDRIHVADNVQWIWRDPEVEQTVLLRRALRDRQIIDAETANVLTAIVKIRVKTYLTDRAQTGTTQTNREKRWEAHPASVQFSLRRDCIKVEHELIEQIAYFDGFPGHVREALLARDVIQARGDVSRCPITLDVHSYAAFAHEVLNPQHGRAAFQVGHLNPLKGPGAGVGYGHTKKNIAWISADGNRIQGHLSMEETRELLRRIATNYEELGEVGDQAAHGRLSH